MERKHAAMHMDKEVDIQVDAIDKAKRGINDEKVS